MRNSANRRASAALWIIAALACSLLGGCQRELSGKYMGKFSNGICWLQLVRTPDDHLTGQIETSELKRDGRIERNAVALTGAANGSDFTISATIFGIQTVTFSGTRSGSNVTLTSSQLAPLVLVRSDLNEYQQQLDLLTTKSKNIQTAAVATAARQRTTYTQQIFVSEVARTTNRMQELDSEADLHLGRFPAVESRYSAITAKMTDLLNRERQLTGNSNASVARGQLVVAMNQASIQTDQLHNSAQSLKFSLQSNVQPVVALGTQLVQTCRTNPPTGLTASQIEARTAACSKLAPEEEVFRTKMTALASSLARLEQVYAQEHKSQERILQTAERME